MLLRLRLISTALCLFATAMMAQEEHIKVDSVNSSYDEQNPILSPDGKKLYFTRSGHPANVGSVIDKGDIWVSEKLGDKWGQAKHAGAVLNHTGLNGVVGFSADGKSIYLLNYFDPDGAGGGNLRNGIAKSTWKNGAWTRPERLRITYFANNSEHISATISPDEKVMVIAMRSFQTFGNEDLYVTFQQPDGSWIQPRNLGETINTFSEEWAPFLSADKSTLYFSSNGHGGQGSRDIFVSRRLDESWTNWSKPVNLGPQVNTPGVELGYSIPTTGDMAFFSSTQNSEGFGDIFAFPLSAVEKAAQAVEIVQDTEPVTDPEPEVETKPAVQEKTLVVMTLQVLDIRTDQPVDATVKLTYGGEETIIDTRELESEDKKWIMSFEEDTRIYVDITAEGYLNYKEEFLARPGVQVIDPEFDTVEGFRLTPSNVGTKIRIENVLFAQGSADFADPAQAQVNLDKLLQLMEANPEMEIQLVGHTDNRGNPKLLKQLSLDRVEAVKNYLVTKGIKAKRIETIGMGGEEPVARNANETGRQRNRRVEFVIVK